MTATISERDLARIACVSSPAALAWRCEGGRWQLPPHLDLLNRRLLDVADGTISRLLIQMPPRHGKSTLTSQYFPAWLLGVAPDRRVILASYEHDFAASWGERARDVLLQYGYLFGVRVKGNHAAGDDWEIAQHRGGMVCTGVGGPLTGRGADLLLIDDPVKSFEDANSTVYRQRAWDWYRSTARTRLQPGGGLVLIMTRWHEDDLAGRILADTGGEPWHVLSLPAVAEPGDVLGRAPGAALWPSQYPLSALESIRATVGPYWWSALYQQRPAPPEGALFRASWWRYWDVLPPLDEQVISVDAAFKGTDDSDFVVMQVWGRSGARFYLLDQARERMDFVGTCAALLALAAKWPAAQVKLVEDAANGPAVISALHARISGLVPVKPRVSGGISDGSKAGRAQAILGMVESGNVYLPTSERAPWVAEFTAECESFPRGAHDDQVDAMTQALQRWLFAREPAALTDAEREQKALEVQSRATIAMREKMLRKAGYKQTGGLYGRPARSDGWGGG